MGIRCDDFVGDLIDFQVQQPDLLTQVVVQFAGDSLALLLLAHDDASGERAIELDRPL